jgi:PAS domain S-box-containing protein
MSFCHDPIEDSLFDDLTSPGSVGSGDSSTCFEPTSDADRGDHEHIVQFYDTQEYLLNVLTNFIFPILSSDDAAVIIATKSRLDALEDHLRDRGAPVERRKARGQLVMIDANDMLGKITDPVDGAPLSMEPIESLLRRLNDKFPKIYVYGELVNLLCAHGDHSSAIMLEELWNGLLKRYKFTLLCGYDMNNFKEDHLEEAFTKVCCNHSRVGPSEDYSIPNEQGKHHCLLVDHLCSTLMHAIETLIAMLKQKARVLETEIERRKAVESTLARYLEILSNRAEESLRHQQESYRILLSILAVGVYSGPMMDEGDGIFINKRFCELSGMSEAMIRSNGWHAAVHVDDRNRVRHLWDTSQKSFGGKEEYRYVLPDGNVCWVTGETVQFTSHEGKARTYVHTIVDITPLKEVERQRAEASRRAEDLLRLRAEQAERHKREQDQFIDTLCHELRNPLSSIHGNVELLQIGLDLRRSILASPNPSAEDIDRLREQSQWDQESLSAIETCVAHQKVITDDVLNLSKLEVGKVVLRKVDFNPKKAVIEATKMFEAEANRKGISLRCNLPVSDVIIKADPDRVSQVLINLLANALKFTLQGCITLGLDFVERLKGQLVTRITVKDTGMGLTKQEQAKLFHRFMQPTSTSYDETAGSGLGLVISKNLVELMGGTISVDSVKGQGSEFTFTFVAEEVKPSVNIWPVTPTPSQKNRKSRWVRNILVVEDNVINQRFLTRLLEVEGFKCSTACNGLEALACIERERFDLILMDVHMPVMDGIATTREIRAREVKDGVAAVPIVGLSGNAREEHQLEALNSGMNCYLTKPCRKNELYCVIDTFDKYVYQGRIEAEI